MFFAGAVFGYIIKQITVRNTALDTRLPRTIPQAGKLKRVAEDTVAVPVLRFCEIAEEVVGAHAEIKWLREERAEFFRWTASVPDQLQQCINNNEPNGNTDV